MVHLSASAPGPPAAGQASHCCSGKGECCLSAQWMRWTALTLQCRVYSWQPNFYREVWLPGVHPAPQCEGRPAHPLTSAGTVAQLPGCAVAPCPHGLCQAEVPCCLKPGARWTPSEVPAPSMRTAWALKRRLLSKGVRTSSTHSRRRARMCWSSCAVASCWLRPSASNQTGLVTRGIPCSSSAQVLSRRWKVPVAVKPYVGSAHSGCC